MFSVGYYPRGGGGDTFKIYKAKLRHVKLHENVAVIDLLQQN